MIHEQMKDEKVTEKCILQTINLAEQMANKLKNVKAENVSEVMAKEMFNIRVGTRLVMYYIEAEQCPA